MAQEVLAPCGNIDPQGKGRGEKHVGLPADGLADFRKQTIGFIFQAYRLLPYLTAQPVRT